MERRVRLRELLSRPDPLVLPGTYNAFVARLIEMIGFQAVYVSGAGITNTLLGAADVGIISYGEVFDVVRHIVNAVGLPILVDVDTGYGNVLNAVRTVRELEAIGVAGIQIEDQDYPKKCGHFRGKRVIPASQMAKKIEAVADQRKDPNFVIMARTDSIATHGIDEAIRRGHLYHRAGADILFIEAPTTMEEIERIAKELPGPKLFNVVEGGLTPQLSYKEIARLGFKVILYANAALRAGAKASIEVLQHLKDHGSTVAITDRLITMNERNTITGLERFYTLEERYFEADD